MLSFSNLIVPPSWASTANAFSDAAHHATRELAFKLGLITPNTVHQFDAGKFALLSCLAYPNATLEIHSYDYRPLAERGLPAANKYARIAPSAPHALHMPSHIYSMLGMWEESIASNKAVLTAAKAYAAKNFGPGVSDPAEVHHYDFMAYAHLQLGQDREAKRIVKEVQVIKKVARIIMDTGFAAPPARYGWNAQLGMRRRRWSRA
jgi:hypothetical protein